MKHQHVDLSAGLYLVATPIGNARDITLRALDVLASADLLAAEDTRTLQKLMQIHGVPRDGRPFVAYHDHAAPEVTARLTAAVRAGQSVACCSEAGMPLISDPGFGLVSAVLAANLPVTVVPGPSASLAALAVAGLPTDRFAFLGFPPAKGGARSRWLAAEAGRAEPVVIYESPRRVAALLKDMVAAWGGARRGALCRELTKLHEEVRRGSLEGLAASVEAVPPRGECVLVVDAAPDRVASRDELEAALVNALATESVKDASASVAQRLGVPRKEAYRMALDLTRDRGHDRGHDG